MDITIAIVNYNSTKLLYECLTSIYDSIGNIHYEVIVVDNASYDNPANQIKRSFPGTSVIVNNKNRGFAKGVNQAFQASKGDFFFLLNPDTRLLSNIFPGMLEFFHCHPEAGIVAPRIVFPDGKLHPSARRFITLPGAIMDLFQIHFYFPGNIIAKRFDYNNWEHDKVREVDWVTGAAFLTRSDILAECGMMDERYFMYFEDMDYCMSVREKGYKIFFCPQFSVVHYHAKGGSDKLPVRSVDYYISLNKYLLKHKGPLPSLLFRTAMLCWGVFYMFIRAIKHFFSPDDQSLRQRLDVPLRLILNKSHEN